MVLTTCGRVPLSPALSAALWAADRVIRSRRQKAIVLDIHHSTVQVAVMDASARPPIILTGPSLSGWVHITQQMNSSQAVPQIRPP